jgi:hypothetical protein
LGLFAFAISVAAISHAGIRFFFHIDAKELNQWIKHAKNGKSCDKPAARLLQDCCEQSHFVEKL